MKILLIFFFIIGFNGCYFLDLDNTQNSTKENIIDIDEKFLGEWDSSEHNYLITSNIDQVIPDLYNSPWIGSFIISGEDIAASNNQFSLSGNNVFGGYIFYNQDLFLQVYGNYLSFNYNNKRYSFDVANFDLRNGVFSAIGNASEDDTESILAIEINLFAQQKTISKDELIEIKDIKWFEKININTIEFYENMNILGYNLALDVMEPFYGTWKTNNKLLTLNYLLEFLPDTSFTSTFSYEFIDENSITLSETLSTKNKSEYEALLGLSEGSLATLSYKKYLKRRE